MRRNTQMSRTSGSYHAHRDGSAHMKRARACRPRRPRVRWSRGPARPTRIGSSELSSAGSFAWSVAGSSAATETRARVTSALYLSSPRRFRRRRGVTGSVTPLPPGRESRTKDKHAAPRAASVRTVAEPARRGRPEGGDNQCPIDHARCHPCPERTAGSQPRYVDDAEKSRREIENANRIAPNGSEVPPPRNPRLRCHAVATNHGIRRERGRIGGRTLRRNPATSLQDRVVLGLSGCRREGSSPVRPADFL